MKLIFMLWLLILCQLAKGNLMINEFSWTNYEIPLSLDKKKEKIKRIDHWILSYYENSKIDLLKDEKTLSWFHFLEFSGDGLLDIVYCGPSGSESFITIFLENTGKEYKKSLSFYGAPLDIYKPLTTQPAIIKMHEVGCCEDPISSIQVFYPKNEKGRLTYFLMEKFNYIEGTVFPLKESISELFVVKNEKYNLRSSPSMINGENSNVIAEYMKDATGIGIASYFDEKENRMWWFVVMDKSNMPKSTKLNIGINNEEDYQAVGWMSSKYLEVIE